MSGFVSMEDIHRADLPALKSFQPPGWDDIVSEFSFYIDQNWCRPVKCLLDNAVVGVGAYLDYGASCWLAHIIVSEEMRSKGIGGKIMEYFLERNAEKPISLIATDAGEPLYLKYGFVKREKYLFFHKEEDFVNDLESPCYEGFKKEYERSLLEMDKVVSGEDRELLLRLYMNEAVLYVKEGELRGFYSPKLKEGPVIALDEESGLELLKVKIHDKNKVVVPESNPRACEFLIRNGFELSETYARRMSFGEDFSRKPGLVFSRIGGNFG